MKTVTIEIAQLVGSGICIAADDGKIVYEKIYEALRDGHKVVLSFYNVTRMTTAFLNAAVGQLYGEFPEDFVKERMGPPIHWEAWHLTRLKLVVDRAKVFFQNPERTDEILRNNRGD